MDRRYSIRGQMKLDGAAIREARHSHGITQQWLANRLHISRGILASYETGRRKVPPSLMQAVFCIFSNSMSGKKIA